MKMTTFIIGVILVAIIMTGFGIILSDMTPTYDTTYSDSDMVAFEQMDGMKNLTDKIKTRVENQSTDRSVADVIGGFIADGKDTLLLAAQSYDIFETMSDEGMEKVRMPNVFKIGFYAIMLILIFVGIILAAIIGREL